MNVYEKYIAIYRGNIGGPFRCICRPRIYLHVKRTFWSCWDKVKGLGGRMGRRQQWVGSDVRKIISLQARETDPGLGAKFIKGVDQIV